MTTMYLIQGIFFEDNYCAETDPTTGEYLYYKKLCGYLFSGLIHSDPSNPEKMIGSMIDCFDGESSLTDVVISKENFSFIKRYLKSDRPAIAHEFIKQKDGFWVGKYKGEQMGDSVNRCVLTEIDESFLEIKTIESVLGIHTSYEHGEASGLFLVGGHACMPLLYLSPKPIPT